MCLMCIDSTLFLLLFFKCDYYSYIQEYTYVCMFCVRLFFGLKWFLNFFGWNLRKPQMYRECHFQVISKSKYFGQGSNINYGIMQNFKISKQFN